ncbi:uncharacterized protein IL334_003705 [Kwoniella shivajii]|uniref:CoA-binding domain-containing protein n=1 Tax=Kwoniella shivajii TaxID=564305 RepID=A0ABZ1CYB7_9TREE|nr:hypothetical protein IL334_003705 [Kwoniella shivajii]
MASRSVPDKMKGFLSAERYAVIGRVMSDRSRWDNRILRWYQTRQFPVVGVRPDKASEEIEGLELITDPTLIPQLPKTSISIIINPLIGLSILKSLFPQPPQPDVEPRAVWFQPGADDASIWQYVKERGIEDKVIGRGACVYRDGDDVLDQIKRDKGRL